MRSLLLAICLVGLVILPCFAQQPVSTSTSKVSPAAVETKTLTGKVESISLADPVKGTKSEIVIESPVEAKEIKEKDVVNEKDQKTTFLVNSTTTIYDTDWKAISFDKIAKDEKVRVKYTTTKEGVNEAVSINLKK